MRSITLNAVESFSLFFIFFIEFIITEAIINIAVKSIFNYQVYTLKVKSLENGVADFNYFLLKKVKVNKVIAI